MTFAQLQPRLDSIEYHRRYFSEPEEFRPSRWYKQHSAENDESEEYTAFSIGMARTLTCGSLPLMFPNHRSSCMPWAQIRDDGRRLLSRDAVARLADRAVACDAAERPIRDGGAMAGPGIAGKG